MVKLYLRYRQKASFGTIASANSNIIYDSSAQLAVCPALENVHIYNLKLGEQTAAWSDVDNKAEVTFITRQTASKDHSDVKYAVGYSDGSIRIWSMVSSSTLIVFNGHRAAVTYLAFDRSGTRLVSGSRDTDIIVWDIVAESGLFRLRGHKDQITGLVFLDRNDLNHLVSTSKDTLMKIWDLTTQHCIETLVAHRSEVWALAASPDQLTLYTGAADPELRVWKLDPDVLAKKLEPVGPSDATESAQTSAVADELAKGVTLHGALQRQSKERVTTLRTDHTGRYIGIQGADRLVEVFKVRTAEEVKKRLARRKKRQKEKKSAKGTGDPATDPSLDGDDEADILPTVADEIPTFAAIRCSAKVRSFDFSPKTKESEDAPVQVLCSLTNNTIELWSAGLDSAEEPTKLTSSIEIQGHRSDIRTLALSTDDDLLVSGSNSGIKIWNTLTQKCVQTLGSGYALCSAFVPGNKHVVIGTKTGELELFDLASSSLLESIKAHDGPIWSLQVRPDKTGITTGSADKEVKFWDFQLIQDSEYSKVARRLTLVPTRILKMSDDVLSVCHSPDGSLLAVSLLDSTVKVFYTDTLKFFLSLYGHKLPVLSMDISSDGALIATGSADKTLKLWGLDFGDCHKSLIAHEDSVMVCRFVWGTHSLFTAGKDKTIKYWDADKFEQILKLEGHHGEVWSLAVAKYGRFIVTGSHDKSIRIWEKTDEQFVLEEERERELEELYEKQRDDRGFEEEIGSGAPDANPDASAFQGPEVGSAGKRTAETLKAGEKIMEALDVWEQERAALDVFEMQKSASPDEDIAPPPRSPYILAFGDPSITPEGYVLKMIERIRLSDLNEALLVLPFGKVVSLLKVVLFWIEKRWNKLLSSRILFFLLNVHHSQLVTTRTLRPTLIRLRKEIHNSLQEHRDIIGFNLAGLRYLRTQWEAEHSTEFYDDVGVDGAAKGQGSSVGGPTKNGKSGAKMRVVVKG
ncbi:WD40-repeat-containing domain protein [Polychytrium aggregatum]|uniref:WD40-repeat-containing domain protein n=1 Tax=Polychytrium aggregatum TaxID=110093 RepID=UPI0022FE9453|nr:WD40-repeat-containing domain protein [Polychytrium aggregatum]KAI9207367.1 WD40-repeat-containing domain protein [Polychytrium aggregatum]